MFGELSLQKNIRIVLLAICFGLACAAAKVRGPVPQTPDLPPGTWVWPISGSAKPDADGIRLQFGPRREKAGYDFHAGIDFPVPEDTPVRAVADGVVANVTEDDGRKKGPGNKILIKHADDR